MKESVMTSSLLRLRVAVVEMLGKNPASACGNFSVVALRLATPLPNFGSLFATRCKFAARPGHRPCVPYVTRAVFRYRGKSGAAPASIRRIRKAVRRNRNAARREAPGSQGRHDRDRLGAPGRDTVACHRAAEG